MTPAAPLQHPGSRALRRAASPFVTAVVLVCGCATQPASPLGQPMETQTDVSVETPDGTTRAVIRHNDYVAITDLAAPQAEVWKHVMEVWAELGLPDPTVDARTHTLFVNNHVVTRRLGQTPLSTYLNCGTSISGWNADSQRIRLSVRILVERVAAEATRVHTRVDATAQAMGGASSGILQCTTRGALETEVATRLRNRLAGLPAR